MFTINEMSVGTADPEMSYIAVMLMGVLLLYLLMTIGYKYIRYLFRVSFERLKGETYAEWFEKNQASQLVQYLGALRLSLSSNGSNRNKPYSSITKSIKAAFGSTEGEMTTVEMNELPAQIVSTQTDGTDIIEVNDEDDDEEEEEEVMHENINNNIHLESFIDTNFIKFCCINIRILLIKITTNNLQWIYNLII